MELAEGRVEILGHWEAAWRGTIEGASSGLDSGYSAPNLQTSPFSPRGHPVEAEALLQELVEVCVGAEPNENSASATEFVDRCAVVADFGVVVERTDKPGAWWCPGEP